MMKCTTVGMSMKGTCFKACNNVRKTITQNKSCHDMERGKNTKEITINK